MFTNNFSQSVGADSYPGSLTTLWANWICLLLWLEKNMLIYLKSFKGNECCQLAYTSACFILNTQHLLLFKKGNIYILSCSWWYIWLYLHYICLKFYLFFNWKIIAYRILFSVKPQLHYILYAFHLLHFSAVLCLTLVNKHTKHSLFIYYTLVPLNQVIKNSAQLGISLPWWLSGQEFTC